MTEEEIKRLEITLDAWKQMVTVQMHFNDIEIKIRNFYFLVVAAAFPLLGAVQGKGIVIAFLDIRISLSMFVIFGLIPISALFYFIDRHWYHRLLQGAVAQSGVVENMVADILPEIQLGRHISQNSPVEFKSPIWRWLFFFVRDKRFREHGRLHSDQKIEVLYKSVMVVCLAIVLGYGLIGGVQVKHCAVLPFLFDLPCDLEGAPPLKANGEKTEAPAHVGSAETNNTSVPASVGDTNPTQQAPLTEPAPAAGAQQPDAPNNPKPQEVPDTGKAE